VFPSCFQIAINLVLLTQVRCVSMCWKPKEVSYDIGFQCLLGFHFEGGQNFDLPKSLIQSKPEISSSHRQLSEIITQSLVRLRHMNSHQKAEEVSYDVGIEGFLRGHSIWGQKSRILRICNSVQNRVSAAQPMSKTHIFYTIDPIGVCK
jgi:hypothetical protein